MPSRSRKLSTKNRRNSSKTLKRNTSKTLKRNSRKSLKRNTRKSLKRNTRKTKRRQRGGVDVAMGKPGITKSRRDHRKNNPYLKKLEMSKDIALEELQEIQYQYDIGNVDRTDLDAAEDKYEDELEKYATAKEYQRLIDNPNLGWG